jgi:putative ATPase
MLSTNTSTGTYNLIMITPLAEMLRPENLEDVMGQQHIIGEKKIITELVKNKQPASLILWGPPGTGKTTLARIIAKGTDTEFLELSAVTAAKADVVRVIEYAKQNQRLGVRTTLFVDEIHRFNKAQQDAFLPHIENGTITFIGATTENPSFEVIRPLLSRSRVIVLNPLEKEDVLNIIIRARKVLKITKKRLSDKVAMTIAQLAGGDARVALGILELSLQLSDSALTEETVKNAAQNKLPGYDKNGDMHYNLISAFIKSLRASQVDASLYYLARILQAGEDPKFIARRMVIFASEDVGIAASAALNIAVSTFLAVERIGMPECQYNLYHCATVLAKCEKSRESTELMYKAQSLAREYPDASVPLHLRNAPTALMKDLGYGEGMKWEAGFKHPDNYLPSEIQI